MERKWGSRKMVSTDKMWSILRKLFSFLGRWVGHHFFVINYVQFSLCLCCSLSFSFPSSLNKRPTDIRWAAVEMQNKQTKKPHCLLKLNFNKIALVLLHCLLFLQYYIWLSLIQPLRETRRQGKQQRLR